MQKEGRGAEAEAVYRKVMAVNPKLPDPFHLLAIIEHAKGNAAKALELVDRAIKLFPKSPDFHSNRALFLRSLERFEESLESAEKALALNPKQARAHYSRAFALERLGRTDEAICGYRRAIRHDRSITDSFSRLAYLLLRQGRTRAASRYYRKRLAFSPANRLWDLHARTLCPVVPESAEKIKLWRENFTREIAATPEIKLENYLPILHESGAEPPFHMLYHGECNRKLKEAYGRIFTCGGWEAPKRRDGPLRVGMEVSPGHETVFADVMENIINSWDSKDVTLAVICRKVSMTKLSPRLRVAFLEIPHTLAEAASSIRAADFDVVYFWETGSASPNYFLPLMRVARVQCTSWGIPDTSGLGNMDYYISSRLQEPSEPERFYSEKLVLCDSLLTSFKRPELLPFYKKTKGDFGLPEGARIYLCVQNMFKIHPDFDRAAAEILRSDSGAMAVFINGAFPNWGKIFAKRLSRSMPDVINRVRIMSRLNPWDYLALLELADVVLDSFHFGGGITTIQALGMGTPVVTLPGEMMRGRFALACYKLMGVEGFAAETPGEYARIAMKTAGNKDSRAVIRESSSALFGSDKPRKELEKAFLGMVNRH